MYEAMDSRTSLQLEWGAAQEPEHGDQRCCAKCEVVGAELLNCREKEHGEVELPTAAAAVKHLGFQLWVQGRGGGVYGGPGLCFGHVHGMIQPEAPRVTWAFKYTAALTSSEELLGRVI